MDPFIGQIIMFGGNFAPRGWALCNGQLLSIASNSALFAILGTTYGGDGRTTFGLPDMRGRVSVHPGTGPGLSPRRLGEKGGTETVTLNTNQIPAHNHSATVNNTVNTTVNAVSTPGNSPSPGGNVWALSSDTDIRTYSTSANNATMRGDAVDVSVSSTATIGNTGGNGAHNNMQPFLGIHYIIALAGIFPARN
ncbi:phage tail protein [Candidatus Poribacteria bacterium]|nr:phage tail protein [Candidatus Poribacteria bacterium]